MNFARITLALAFASFAAAACSVESTERAGVDAPERGLGKADGVHGSCGNDYADYCGGPAPKGNCWCDDLCADYGDCCADKADVCGGEDNVDPTPALCLGDAACGEGQVCDHSECLSGCPEGGFCPAVCFGQCVEADDDACDINPLTVLCSDGTFFSVEECACVAPDEPPPASDCEPSDDSYTAVTGAELAADPSAFVNQRVWLTGVAQTSFPICTQLACSPANPCCNSCGAGITMAMDSFEIEMSNIGCGGNNCDVLANCEYGNGVGFSAWGTVTELFGTLFLEVDGHCGT